MSWVHDQWEDEDEAAEEWRLRARNNLVQVSKEGSRIKELRAARDACRTGGKEAQDRLMNKLDNVWELLQNIMLHYRWSANASITPAQAEDERRALHKLALAALQFLANLTAGNPRTASWVFEESYTGHFLEYMEAFSMDRDLVMCTCVIIHNHLALAEDKGLAVEKLLEDGALICKLMRILLPQSTSCSSSSSSSSEEGNDPVFEWVYLILLKILETGQGKEAFEKTGLDEDTLHDMMTDYEPQSDSDDESSLSKCGDKKSESLTDSLKQQGLYEPPPVFTAEQLVFLNLLEHILTDTYVHGGSNNSSSSSANTEQKEEGNEAGGVKSSSLLVIKDGGAMLLEMLSRVKTCLKHRPLYTPTTTTTNAAGQQQQQQQQPYYAEVMMIEEAMAAVIRLLGGALAMEVEGEEGREGGYVDREALVENGLVGVILSLLRQEGGQADGSIPHMDATPAAAAAGAAATTVREGRKAQLIRVLGNLCHRCRSAQDEVRREEGGLALVLNHCNVDSSNPFLREWALFCVRNLCEGNEENQRVVSELQVQGAVQTSMLREVGLEARLVEGEGEGGRARVTLTKVTGDGEGGGK